MRFLSALIFAMLTFLTGCSHIGPSTINRDRADYTASLADSWKSQMLMNLVKIRYGDAPVFLDVASIINQYSQEGELNGSVGWSFPPYGNNQKIGAVGRYYDRPTITYNLLTGEKFARSMMTPISPATVMSLVEGGYPADQVFRLLVHSVNGIRNQYGGSHRMHRGDPEFYKLIGMLRHLQDSGAAAIRVKKVSGRDTLVLIFRTKNDHETAGMGKEIRRMLGLNEGSSEFRVVYGSVASGDDEVALLTRSVIEILTEISSTVEVPPEHISEKRVNQTMESDGDGIKGNMINIHCSNEKPDDAFVAVPYRKNWFWIDDRDFRSKKFFSFLMFVMTLTETGGKEGAPVVTINAGG
jgi:hypothetical protein